MERSLVLILALRSGFLGMIPFRMSPERRKNKQMCRHTQLTNFFEKIKGDNNFRQKNPIKTKK